MLRVAVKTVRSLTHALMTLLTYIRQLQRVCSFLHFEGLTVGVTRPQVDHLQFLKTYVGAYVPRDTSGAERNNRENVNSEPFHLVQLDRLDESDAEL